MIHFKNKEQQNHILYMSPKLGEVLLEIHQFLQDNKLDMTITSLISPKDSISVSSTHQTGRAADMSVRNIPEEVIIDMISYFNHKHKNIAAFSKSKGIPTLMLRHDSGQGDHIHIQLHPRYMSKYAQNAFNKPQERI